MSSESTRIVSRARIALLVKDIFDPRPDFGLIFGPNLATVAKPETDRAVGVDLDDRGESGGGGVDPVEDKGVESLGKLERGEGGHGLGFGLGLDLAWG